jgi:putative SOS response-associated peptidase YedK
MPVILTTSEEIETWMTAPAKEALALQRPLPNNALRIVARGQKQDGAAQNEDLTAGPRAPIQFTTSTE